MLRLHVDQVATTLLVAVPTYSDLVDTWTALFASTSLYSSPQQLVADSDCLQVTLRIGYTSLFTPPPRWATAQLLYCTCTFESVHDGNHNGVVRIFPVTFMSLQGMGGGGGYYMNARLHGLWKLSVINL